MIELRDYQAEDVAKILDAFKRGVRRVLYVLPTGGGKTTEFCHIAQRAAAKGTNTGILVHRAELLRQSSRALDANGVDHGCIAPGYHASKSLVQVASVQTLVRRLKDYLNFRFLIVDEAHHATAGSWQKIFDAYPDIMILGVTATPIRTDGTGLGNIFQEMIVGPSIARLMEEGYLCRAKVYAPPTQIDLSGIAFRGGDYAKEELNARIRKSAIIGDAVAHYQRICPGQPAIAFCASISEAERTASRFKDAGWRFRTLDGEMADDYREETIRFLGTGQIDGIASCDLISEGTDIPVVTVCISERPTQSTGLHMQQLGRVLRPIYAPGFNLKTIQGRLAAIAASQKPFAIVLDHVGNCIEHGWPDDDRDWSLAGEKKKKPKAARYEEEEDIKRRRCPECYHLHKPAKKCPECQHEYVAVGRSIAQLPGELVAYNRATLETLMKSYKTLTEYLKIAKRDGYTETWAHGAFNRQNDKIRECRNVINETNQPIIPVLGGSMEEGANHGIG